MCLISELIFVLGLRDGRDRGEDSPVLGRQLRLGLGSHETFPAPH